MKSIVTYYEILPDGTIKDPPRSAKVRLKSFWTSAKRFAQSDLRKVVVRREDTIFEGDVEAKRAFFEGAVKYFYTTQQLGREPTSLELQKYREIILDELLTYTYTLPKGLSKEKKEVKGRISTTSFNAHKWETFFETAKEVLFEPSGYEFPDRAEFKKMVESKKDGGLGLSNMQATAVLRKSLWQKIKAKKITELRSQIEAEQDELDRYLKNPRGFEDDIACSRGAIVEMRKELEVLEDKIDFI